MTDHDGLREAITMARDEAAHLHVRSFAPEWRKRAERLTLLATAAESTLPKTKMVEVWHVECVNNGEPVVWAYPTEGRALHQAASVAGIGYHCIRVTGPWQQEVPA